MKLKYLIIGLLVGLLVWVIYEMLRYEQAIREERVVEVKVKDETKQLIDKLPEKELAQKARRADYYAQSKGDHFEVLEKTGSDQEDVQWNPVFLKGVNLGAALPGKFPSEFPRDFDVYLKWFRKIGQMEANVLRIYTIYPPVFYEAFNYYNLHHHQNKLYLMHGVWAKQPPEQNYNDHSYTRDLKKEIMDVIDVIHGRASIEPKKGKAHGTYVSDVSDHVVGLLLGREWEPEAVHETNKINSENSFNGSFISMPQGTPMEEWLARMMNFTILYETQTYGAQHPISFVNWLPLDPMHHNTEIIENETIREFDNDLESIDFTDFHATENFYPGLYAAYHAYPYYPDYIYLNKKYRNTLNRFGQKDNYLAYLNDLKSQHQGMPLVIAEYGLPSSRGNSHYTPYGFDQGGHSEAKQASLSKVLTQDIYDSECAGAIYFEWMDEWFKHNWLVMEFEKPFQHRHLWHNMENPEQNFGILAMESKGKTIDGKPEDWDNFPETQQKPAIKADADPGYFYLGMYLPEFSFGQNDLHIALDTYGHEKGDHNLPFLRHQLDYGVEFLVNFYNTDSARILVDDKYSVFTDIYNDSIPVYASKENYNGKFSEQILLSNRGRVSLLEDTIERVNHNRSPLLHGKSNEPATSNADWYWNDRLNFLEVRLTWHLLNVSDPSSRYVLDDKPDTPEIEYSETSRFQIQNFITGNKNNLEKVFPQDPYSYIWRKWEEPEFRARIKPVYDTLKQLFSRFDPPKDPQQDPEVKDEKFFIAPFYKNKKAAVSPLFTGSNFSYYEHVLPVLNKYHFRGTFGVVDRWLKKQPALVNDHNEVKVKKTGKPSIREIHEDHKNKIAAEPFTAKARQNIPVHKDSLIAFLKHSKKALEGKIKTRVQGFYYNTDKIDPFTVKKGAKNTDYVFAFNNEQGYNAPVRFNNYTLKSFQLKNKNLLDNKALNKILEKGENKWMIFDFPYIEEPGSKVYQKIKAREELYVISPKWFEWQIRLFRNSNYWVAPVETIGAYLMERKHSSISLNRHKNFIFLNINNELDQGKFNQPLTIGYKTHADLIQVTNSAEDGYYENRTGTIYFEMYPSEEVTIEIIKP